MVKSRFSAAFLHLLMSGCVIAALLAVIFFIWYPAPYFQISGALAPVLVLVSVDLVIGPLLTLVVYNTEKKSLKADLAVIVVLQLAAFLYGAHALASQRPVFVVLDGGVLEVVAWPDIQDASEPPSELLDALPIAGPMLVWADSPDKSFYLDAVFSGDNAALHPEFYHPIADGVEVIQQSGVEITAQYLKENKDVSAAIEGVGGVPAELLGKRIFPINARQGDWSAVLDAETGELLLEIPVGVEWIK